MLICDDEEDMLDFLERVFRAEYEVTRVDSAAEALATLRRSPGFRVLITDHKMPDMTGLELLAAIEDDSLVRVLLSGFADMASVGSPAPAYRLDAHVVKPVDSASLRAAVRAAIERRDGETGEAADHPQGPSVPEPAGDRTP